jgi:hypothetical protein
MGLDGHGSPLILVFGFADLKVRRICTLGRITKLNIRLCMVRVIEGRVHSKDLGAVEYTTA